MPGPLNSAFCIHVQRRRVERRGALGKSRTVGDYQCYAWGKSLPELSGQMAESGGPGDNSDEIGDVQDRRIVAGVYPLHVHATLNYRTFAYTADQNTKSKPRPALLLGATSEREGILIHPSSGYLWSTGCLNPCSGLQQAASDIDYRDSRRRVVAIIDTLTGELGARMPKTPGTRIPDAYVLIEGEPV